MTATAPRGIFFVHVMKTGGISVNRRLRTLVAAERTYPRFTGDGTAAFAKLSVDELAAACTGTDLGLVTTHLPAWTAAAFAPDHLHVTVLRDPLARTLSHLHQLVRHGGAGASIEQVWGSARYRTRLTDYQTRVFATDQPQPGPRLGPDDLSGDEIRDDLEASWLTASDGSTVDEAGLERAIDRLMRFTVVGVTERLDRFAARLGAASGLPVGRLDHENAGDPVSAAPAWLVDEIRSATTLDRRLYDRARHLADG